MLKLTRWQAGSGGILFGLLWAICPLLSVEPVWGQEQGQTDLVQKDGDVQEQDGLKEQVANLINEYTRTTAEIMAAGRDLDRAELAELRKQLPKIEDYAPQLMELVKAEPSSEAAWDAYFFIARTARSGEWFGQSAEAIMTHFMDSEKIADFLPALGSGTPEATSMLEKLSESSPFDLVKGRATYMLASTLARSNDPEKEERVIELYETIMAKYADLEMGRDRKLGDVVEGQLFALKNLKIGKVAPDIEGHDLDEVDFKLSDYRGKVVVLDFWGDW
jgi:hypothetical protein